MVIPYIVLYENFEAADWLNMICNTVCLTAYVNSAFIDIVLCILQNYLKFLLTQKKNGL